MGSSRHSSTFRSITSAPCRGPVGFAFLDWSDVHDQGTVGDLPRQVLRQHPVQVRTSLRQQQVDAACRGQVRVPPAATHQRTAITMRSPLSYHRRQFADRGPDRPWAPAHHEPASPAGWHGPRRRRRPRSAGGLGWSGLGSTRPREPAADTGRLPAVRPRDRGVPRVRPRDRRGQHDHRLQRLRRCRRGPGCRGRRAGQPHLGRGQPVHDRRVRRARRAPFSTRRSASSDSTSSRGRSAPTLSTTSTRASRQAGCSGPQASRSTPSP